MRRNEVCCKQRSRTWFSARCGIPTACNFDLLFASAAERIKYVRCKTVERLAGIDYMMQNYVSYAMKRGIALEDTARANYVFMSGFPIKEVGVIQMDLGGGVMCACSPDGMAKDRGLEIKCPLPENLLKMYDLDEPPQEYMMQIQAGMWISGVPKWDLFLFSGVKGIRSKIFTIKADRMQQQAFEKVVPAFCAEVDAMTAREVAAGGQEHWKDRIENGDDIMED